LQSPLGNSIQRKQECQILLNMALLPLDPSEMQKQFGQSAKQMAFPEPRMHMPEPESNLEIEGRPISSDLYQRLCKAQFDDNFKLVALDHNKSPPCSRFDKGEYVQSRLIYQNKPVLVAIFGDQLYAARPDSLYTGRWPHPEFMRDVKTGALVGESMLVDQVEPLVIDSDNLARSADIRASLSVGRLKYQRNLETKHPSNLETPFRSILA
ncbi:hypothetical protein IW148_005329, partial [Coemansia sp. RSA 1199]